MATSLTGGVALACRGRNVLASLAQVRLPGGLARLLAGPTNFLAAAAETNGAPPVTAARLHAERMRAADTLIFAEGTRIRGF
jgi:hypothetical protein